MRYGAHLLLLVIGLISPCFADVHLAWQRTYPRVGPYGEQGIAIDDDSLGGYIVSTNTHKLLRIASDGDTLWWRQLEHRFDDVKFLRDGRIVGTGWTTDAQLGIFALDTDGNPLWQYEYEPTEENVGSDGSAICQTEDGGIVAAGSILYRGREPYTNRLIVKVDSLGAELWQRQSGTPNDDSHLVPQDIVAVSNNGIVTASETVITQYWSNGWARKICNNPQLNWDRTYVAPGEYHEQAYRCCCGTVDGQYIFAGYRYTPYNGNSHDVLINGISTGGGVQWTTVISHQGDQEVKSVCELGSGNIVAVGTSSNRAMLLLLSPTGQVLVDSVIDSESSAFFDCKRTPDGGCVVGGSRDGKVWILKFCPENADRGHIEVLYNSRNWGAYKLVHDEGELSTLAFSPAIAGTVGFVTGPAAQEWSVMPGGDGNDGDSIIFRTLTPLTSGSLDTFWVFRPTMNCHVHWTAGCRSDTVEIWNSSTKVNEFWAGHVGADLQFRVSVENENSMGRYEIWATRWQSFVLRQTIQATNDPLPHSYTFNHEWPWYKFVLRMYDQNECLVVHADTIEVPVDVPVLDERPPLPSSFSVRAFPNPFNAQTSLELQLPHENNVYVTIMDLLGREVRSLPASNLPAGTSRLSVDLSGLSSGLYFARVQAGQEERIIEKLMLIR